MDSRTAAHVLSQIAAFLELKGDSSFKCRAYDGAAKALLALGAEDVAPRYRSRAQPCADWASTLAVVRDSSRRASRLPGGPRVDARRTAGNARRSRPLAAQDPLVHQALSIETLEDLGSGERRAPRQVAEFGPKIVEKILKGIAATRARVAQLYHHAPGAQQPLAPVERPDVERERRSPRRRGLRRASTSWRRAHAMRPTSRNRSRGWPASRVQQATVRPSGFGLSTVRTIRAQLGTISICDGPDQTGCVNVYSAVGRQLHTRQPPPPERRGDACVNPLSWRADGRHVPRTHNRAGRRRSMPRARKVAGARRKHRHPGPPLSLTTPTKPRSPRWRGRARVEPHRHHRPFAGRARGRVDGEAVRARTPRSTN